MMEMIVGYMANYTMFLPALVLIVLTVVIFFAALINLFWNLKRGTIYR